MSSFAGLAARILAIEASRGCDAPLRSRHPGACWRPSVEVRSSHRAGAGVSGHCRPTRSVLRSRIDSVGCSISLHNRNCIVPAGPQGRHQGQGDPVQVYPDADSSSRPSRTRTSESDDPAAMDRRTSTRARGQFSTTAPSNDRPF